MSVSSLSISLPQASPELRAAILDDLRLEFVRAGAPPQDVALERDSENMDFGASLLVGLGALGWAAAQKMAEGAGSGFGKVLGEHAARAAIKHVPRIFDDAIGFVQRKYHTLIEVKTDAGVLLHYGESRVGAADDRPPELGDLAVILFGASQYPHYADLSRDSFAESARQAKMIFAPEQMNFSKIHMLDLYEYEGGPYDHVKQMRAHQAFETGEKYYLGLDGEPADDTSALNWFRKAAALGHAESLNYVGYMYRKGEGIGQDEAEAVRWYRKSAEAGNATGMNNLGFACQHGICIGQDKAEAVRWYRKSAEAGDVSGMFNLGYAYNNGYSIDQDTAEAVRWYRKSAEAGETVAMVNLGYAYEHGNGIDEDKAEALRWYRKSAEAGDAKGMFILAYAYDYGKGIGQDKAEAVCWYRKSAEAGNAAGMYNLGSAYDHGDGIGQDKTEAVRWYRKSAEAGNETAKRHLADLLAS